MGIAVDATRAQDECRDTHLTLLAIENIVGSRMHTPISAESILDKETAFRHLSQIELVQELATLALLA